MPTPQELELLALAAQERQRTAPVPAPPALPALETLLQPTPAPTFAARVAQTRQQPEMAMLEGLWGTPESREAATPQVAPDPEMASLEALWGSPEGSSQDVAPPDEALLSNLFMGREAQEAQAVLGGQVVPGGGNRHGFDIEFDSDWAEDSPVRATPNEAARWRVGRESPPASTFRGGTPVSGPSDGVVVRSREGRTWQEAPRPTLPRNEAVAQSVRAARTAAAAAPPPPRPEPVHRPTVYQHIMRGSVLGDD